MPRLVTSRYKRKSENWIDWEGTSLPPLLPQPPLIGSPPTLAVPHRSDVQRTRCNVIKAYIEAPAPMRAPILKDCVIIHLHSVTPPGAMPHHPQSILLPSPSDGVRISALLPLCKDRVGVIRKLRWGLSLLREGEDFVIDTTKQRHKSMRPLSLDLIPR